MSSEKRLLALSCFVALFVPVCGNAGTILFSNLVEPGDQYGPDGVGLGHTPAFPNPGDYLIYAVPFTPTSTALLTSFEAPLGVASGTNQLQAFLYSDASGAPGSIIEFFPLSGLPTFGFPFPLLTVNSVLDPMLIAGHQYWIGVTGGPATFGMWSLNLFQGNAADGGASREILNGIAQPWVVGSGERTGALEVVGTIVPEPSYTVLCACVLLSCVKRIHRQSEQGRERASVPCKNLFARASVVREFSRRRKVVNLALW
jgi:hypothetical protein